MCDDLFGSLRSSISFKTVIHQQLNHSSKIRGNSTPVHLISVIPPPPRTSVHLLSTWPNEGCLKASEIQYLTTWLYPGQTSKVIKRRGKVGGAKADRWTRTRTIGQVTRSACLCVLLTDCDDFCCLLFIYFNIYKKQLFIYLRFVL